MFSPIIQSPNCLKNIKKKLLWAHLQLLDFLKLSDKAKTWRLYEKVSKKCHCQNFGSALMVCPGLTEREKREVTEDNTKEDKGRKPRRRNRPCCQSFTELGLSQRGWRNMCWGGSSHKWCLLASEPAAALPQRPGPYLLQSRKEKKIMNPKGPRLIPTSHPPTDFPAPVGELLF